MKTNRCLVQRFVDLHQLKSYSVESISFTVKNEIGGQEGLGCLAAVRNLAEEGRRTNVCFFCWTNVQLEPQKASRQKVMQKNHNFTTERSGFAKKNTKNAALCFATNESHLFCSSPLIFFFFVKYTVWLHALFIALRTSKEGVEIYTNDQ